MKPTFILCCLALGFFFFLKPACAQTVFPFEGQLDIPQKKFRIIFHLEKESSISLEAEALEEKKFQLLLNIDHLTTPLLTLSTMVRASLEVGEGDASQKTFAGRLESQYTLINFKPISEVAGQLEIKEQKIYFHSLSFGQLSGRGVVEMKYLPAINFVLKLSDVPLQDFLALWVDGEEMAAEGFVNGEIQIGGEWNRLLVKGTLSSYNGRVEDWNFDSIVLNLEGIYPVIHLYNSNVTESNGLSFGIDGSLDLEDKENFPKQLLALTKAPLVNQDSSELEWTFKRIQKGEKGSTTELKYLLKKKISTSPSETETSDMLGIERRVPF